MSTKLAKSWKSKKPCMGTYNCFSGGIIHTLLAAGMEDFEGFHSIDILEFLPIDFTGFGIIVLIMVLMDVPKWWSHKQRNHDDQAGITDNGTCYITQPKCTIPQPRYTN